MINYKVRPAISTKIILEYCQQANFSMPEEFNRIGLLNDEDLISMNMVTQALETIEKNSDNDIFYFDIVELIETRWVNFFKSQLRDNNSHCGQLANFHAIYPGKIASVDWQLIDRPTSLTMTASRTHKQACTKFDDLILFNFVSKLISLSPDDQQCNISIALPFERNFYGKYVDMFSNVTFEAGAMAITIEKSQQEIKEQVNYCSTPSQIALHAKVIAAANMVAIDQLDLNSLAFVLNTSVRTLQRTLKSHGLSASHLIREVKFNRARNLLIQNQCNIKKTSLECGFKDQARLTKLFSSFAGVTPSQYSEQLRANQMIDTKTGIVSRL
ncbi:helix-turn-helix domain-containing protein [Shewanella waksmanii]|uniref:helix-turn-helix domain-containing protein n=1 Tax=Shewanella waksmanii TaxID=213783 RepID=UPI00373552CA